MKVYTTYPVTIDKKRINAPDYYLNADGDEYIPFDGKTELERFCDESGETFYCSADGEDFYNAKGQKLLGAFKKIGKNVVKAGKFIGKVAKKVARSVVQASKTVVKNVKTAGGKAKENAKKLIHHKKKEKSKTPEKGKGKEPEKKGEDNDVFTKELPPATPNTPAENVVDIAGKKYDATDIPKGKEIVETVNENGQKIAGVEFKPEEVVAVTGADGNIEYHTPDAVGMSKGMKIALIVGGSILVLSIIGLVIYKSRGNKGK